jgi:hypothetical protein
MISIQQEHAWLVDHHSEAEKHSGRWIAILDEKMIADGRSFNKAHKRADALHPGKVPLIAYIPKKDEELLIL